VPAAAIGEPPPDAAQFDSEALWERLAARDWRGAPVLVVRGDGGRDWLAQRLRERGAQVAFVAAYHRAAPRFDAAQRQLLDATLPPQRWLWTGAALLLLLTLMSLALAWQAQQRVASVQQELVRRQQDSAGQSTEARVLAKQAQDGMRELAAKLALVEARVAEVAIQRGQLEELIQSLSRSRDENVLVDI